MKKLFQLSLITIALLSMASCNPTYYTYTSRTEKIKSVQLQATTTMVDINVDFKHRVTAESDYCFNVASAKEEAQYNAITKNNIDILVDPIFKVEVRGSDKKVKAYVTGFAGYYTNARPAIQDVQQLKDVDMENIEKHILLSHPTMLPAIKEAELQKESSVVVNNYNEKAAQTASTGSEVTPSTTKANAKKK